MDKNLKIIWNYVLILMVGTILNIVIGLGFASNSNYEKFFDAESNIIGGMWFILYFYAYSIFKRINLKATTDNNDLTKSKKTIVKS